MRKKMYWGITFLILIIGVVGVYFMLQKEEAKWEELFAAEAAENAKIHARKVADYELLKKEHAIIVKLASMNRQIDEIGGTIDEIGVTSEDGELLSENFSTEEINDALRRIRELRQQKQLLFAEYDRLTEELGNDD